MGDWQAERRPVPDALLEDFEAEPYRDPFADTISQRLDSVMRERLEAFKLIGSGLGDAGRD